MFVGLARYDLRLPECRSLKDKRSVVKGLTALVRKKFNASVAEVEHQDLWQRATLAVAVVAGEHYHVQRVLTEIGRHMDTYPGVELLSAEVDVVSPE